MIRSNTGALTRTISLCLAVAMGSGCGGGETEQTGSPQGMQPPGNPQAGSGPKPTGGAGAPAMTNTGTGMAGRTAMVPTMPGNMAAAGKPAATGGAGAPAMTAGGSTATAGAGGAAAGSGAATGGAGGAGGAAGGAAGSGETAAAGSGGTTSAGGDNHWIRGADPADSLSGAEPGPYAVDRYTDGYRNGPAYADSTINYPTDAEPPFALVVVVPGFVSPQSSIASWGPFLASHGIVTMTIGTNLPTDAPGARKDALIDAMQSLKEENDRSGSPLEGKLDVTYTATMGWSMGGGGTLLVANENPELKATISLCGWNPGYPYTMIKSPALMFASLGDPLAGGQSQGFYRSIPDATPKMLIEVGAGDHFVANNPASTGGMIGRYGLAWLKVFLEGDERYRKFLQQEPAVPTTDFQSNVK
jgi:dienelactone hydrolase